MMNMSMERAKYSWFRSGMATQMRQRWPIVFLALLICLSYASSAQADTILVPADYSTIQSAINAAGNADVIIVSASTYTENINFGGKNIVLTSTDPTDPAVVAATIIDGGRNGTVVYFNGSEPSTCVLAGFTITNGLSEFGGGITSFGTDATIRYNRIIENESTGQGGGIYWCDKLIEKNVIAYNIAALSGGGLYRCHGTIQNNVIAYNRVTASTQPFGTGVGSIPAMG